MDGFKLLPRSNFGLDFLVVVGVVVVATVVEELCDFEDKSRPPLSDSGVLIVFNLLIMRCFAITSVLFLDQFLTFCSFFVTFFSL